MKTPTLLIAAIALSAPLSAQAPEITQQLFASRDSVWRAWFANDTAVLHRLIPPALATLEGDQRWSDRASNMSASRGFAASGARVTHLRFTNNDVSAWGSTAIVRSNYEFVVESGGKRDTSRGRAIELFVHDGKRWVNPYWQLIRDVAAERELPLPDSLGTNFSAADSLKGRGSATDYDKLIGLWEFRFQPRNRDGTWLPPFTGHWSFEKKPGGNIIEDHWRPDDPSQPMGVSLYTYRVFDPRKKTWQIIGANATGGQLTPGVTWADDANIYGIQFAPDNIMRFRYYSITADHFLWRSDRSFDGGKTWRLDTGIMEAKRVGK